MAATAVDWRSPSEDHQRSERRDYHRLHFVGITDIEFIRVQPTDIPGRREAAVASALAEALSLATTWGNAPAAALTVAAQCSGDETSYSAGVLHDLGPRRAS